MSPSELAAKIANNPGWVTAAEADALARLVQRVEELSRDEMYPASRSGTSYTDGWNDCLKALRELLHEESEREEGTDDDG